MLSGASSNNPSCKTSYAHYGLIFLAAALAMAWQFVFLAIYQNANDDAAVLFKYVPQFVESFRQGIIYPRWMPGDWGGYGAPAFVFYSPLLYLLASLLHMTGLGLVFIKALLEFLSLYAGGVFIFLLVREGHGTKAGLASALLYILLPSRILDLYYFNSPAARFAQAFMPMALFFARRYMDRPLDRLNLAGLGISYAALVLSHIATAYIFTPFLFLYGVFGTTGRINARKNLLMLAAIGSGLLLSSFFFIPVLFERGEIQLWLLDRFTKGGYFLFGPATLHALAETESPGSLIISAISLEAGLLAVSYYLFKKLQGHGVRGEARFYIASVTACLFMMSSISAPLWKYLPGLETVVFSLRFESINRLFVCASLGVMAAGIPSAVRRPWPFAALGALLIAGVLAYDAQLVTRTVPVPGTDAVKLASLALFPEYLPRGVDQGVRCHRQDDPPLSSAEEFTYRIARWNCVDRAFGVDSPRGARLRVKTFYFPGWRAWVDGKETPLSAQQGTGAILMDVPAGTHEVTLKFTDTPPRTTGKVVSFLTLALLIIPYGFVRRPLKFFARGK